MTARRLLLAGIAVLALLLLLGRTVAGLYTDYLWYDALGASALWWTRMNALALLRVGGAVIAGLFAFANLYAVRQSVVSLVLQRQLGNVEFGEEVPGRYLMVAAIIVSITLAVTLAAPEDDWVTVLSARSTWTAPFGETDPYTGSDLAFFVYWVPFEHHLWTWTLVLVLVVSAVVILMYALTPSLKWQNGSVHLSAYVRRHFTVLVGVLLLLCAWQFRLDMFLRLVNGSGADGSFGYTDHHVGIPGDLILSLVATGAALVVMYGGFSGQFRLSISAILTVLIIWPLIRVLAPFIVEHGGAEAERLARERPYLVTRASYTRRAFELDGIDTSAASLLGPGAFPPEVPAWDARAIARALAPGKAGDSSWVGWQATSRGLLATVVGPNEAASASADGLSADARSWTLTRVLGGSTDERGSVVRVDSASQGMAEGTTIMAPLVYPDASGVVLVRDSLGRIAGISLERSMARLSAAWSLQDLRILSADLPHTAPAAVAVRDVHERVEHLMPFLIPSRHVQAVLAGDSLYWAVDLYATSESYPLSRHFLVLGNQQSYVHHAAVAVVQGSTGEVVIVADSTLDPILGNWVRRFPNLFGTWGSLPATLRTQLQPHLDGLLAQAAAFAVYGARAGGESTRRIPEIDGADSALAGHAPGPEILRFGASQAGRLAVSVPVLDENDRVRGLLVGLGAAAPPIQKELISRSAPRTATLWLPLSNAPQRWTTILDQLRAADSAATAGPRRGPSPLLHGQVRPVPLRIGVAYVQTSYHPDPDNQLLLDRVAVLSGDSVRVYLPGSAMLRAPGSIRAGIAELSGQNGASARALYAAMRDALRRGDWLAFGRAFEALGRLLGPRPK